MGTADLASDPLISIPDKNIWSFNHEDHHKRISLALSAKFHIPINDGYLDPLPENDMSSWLYTHQQLHSTMNYYLGIQGQDLSTTNWANAQERAYWIWQNLTEHINAGTVLGVV